jgi:hypothetical protein
VPAGAELDQIALIDPSVVFLCYGVNDYTFDLAVPGSFDPEDTAAQFVNAASDITAVCTGDVSFVFVVMWGKTVDGEDAWIPYHDAIVTAASTFGAAVVDIYQELGWQDDTAISDGVHPDERGSEAMSDVVVRQLGAESRGVQRSGDTMTGLLNGTGFIVKFPGDVVDGIRIFIGQTLIGGAPTLVMSDGTANAANWQYLFRTSASTWSMQGAALNASVLSPPLQYIVDHTFVAADAGQTILMNAAGATTVTVPTDATVTFPNGTRISVNRRGAGAVNFAAAGGVTLEVPAALASPISQQYETITFQRIGANTWQVRR